MKEGFITGCFVGLIILFIVQLFIVWGGNPRGMYWKIEDLRKELSEAEYRIYELISNDYYSLEERINNCSTIEHAHDGMYGKVIR